MTVQRLANVPDGIPRVCGDEQVVHRLYGKGGEAVDLIGEHFPEAIVDGGESADVLS